MSSTPTASSGEQAHVASPVTAQALTGRVLNIQHFCIHDGPGIRTTVFLKGCTLRCKWCCNPESIPAHPVLAFDAGKCISESTCGRCLAQCPERAILVAGDGKVRVDRDCCTDCGLCAAVCPSRALGMLGETMSVDEVLAEAEQDATFCRESSGGLTLSGGECLAQPEFSAALLAEAHRRGMTTAVETAGAVPWRAFALVLPHADTVLHDYKLADPEQHRGWVGVDNARILANYRRAYETFPRTRFVARTPVVSGVNDDEATVRAVLEFILPWPNVVGYELLPYHGLGDGKYGYLGRRRELRALTPPAPESLARLRAIVGAAFAQRPTL